MKKRIIILSGVLIAAAALLCTYFIFFREKPAVERDFTAYKLSDKALEMLEGLDEDIELIFSKGAASLKSNTYENYIYDFAKTYEEESKKITVRYDGSRFFTVKSSSGEISFDFEDMFKSFDNDIKYATYCEQQISYSILKLTGRGDQASEGDFAIWGIEGFDANGEYYVNGMPVVFYPTLSRSETQEIVVKNEHGSYKIYRAEDGELYFEGAELCSFKDTTSSSEISSPFSSFIVNATYMLSTTWILPEDGDYAQYGLDSEESALAVMEIESKEGVRHKVLIGKAIPTGGGYYVKNADKDYVYIISADYIEAFLDPITDILVAGLGYVVSSINDIYSINEIFMWYTGNNSDDADTKVYLSGKKDIEKPDNLNAFNSEQDIETLLHDKKLFAGDYSAWKDEDSLVGFNSSDGETVGIGMYLYKYALNGEYKVKFSLVRDTENNAVLPKKVYLQIYDGDGYVTVAELEDMVQAEKSIKTYELSFSNENPVSLIRVCFDTPEKSTGNYVVVDELTAYADGYDATPNYSTMTGLWKLTAPSSFIEKGYNYAVPDTTNLSGLLQGLATLVGDRVVEYDFDPTNENLDKYGLKDYRVAFTYTYENITSYLYVSSKNENGNYYAFASISTEDKDGKVTSISTNIIAEISPETAEWLEWPADYMLERALMSIHIDKVENIEITSGDEKYNFNLLKDNSGVLSTVECNGTQVDTYNFRRLFVSLLSFNKMGLLDIDEKNEANEILRIKINLIDGLSTEYIFYRESATKVYYEKDGKLGESYIKISDVFTITDNIGLLLDGKDIPQ